MPTLLYRIDVQDVQVWSVVATMRQPPVEIVEKVRAGVMEIVHGSGENVYTSNIVESAVQLLHLVHTMKVTVRVTKNAKEALSVVQGIVLNIFHLVQIAVKLRQFQVSPQLQTD